MLAYEVHLIAHTDPIKFITNCPILMGWIGKWAVILIEFNIFYIPQRAIKGQVLADFLAAHHVLDDSPLITKLPNEEVLTTEDMKPHW